MEDFLVASLYLSYIMTNEHNCFIFLKSIKTKLILKVFKVKNN